MTCPNCHHELSGSEKFCRSCGQRIPRCPTCNAVLTSRMKYCKYDGTRIPPEVYVDEPAASAPQTASAPRAKTTSSRNTVLILAAALLIIAILAAGAFLISRVIGGFEDASAEMQYTSGESAGSTSAQTLQDSWGKSGEEDTPAEEDPITEEADEPEVPQPEPAEPAREETEEPQEAPADESEEGAEFIFPDSDSRYLTESEVLARTAAELRIARNEIYARHGRMFDSPDLDAHFRATSWYVPRYTTAEFDALGATIFNSYESANIDLILEAEGRFQ